MSDTPGWASPGSSDSDEPDRGDSPSSQPDIPNPARPADDTGAEAPAGTGTPTDAGAQAGAGTSTWSRQQPPPAGGPVPPGAGWGSPSPGPPYGWGVPQGGQQPARWGPPPAAKPGVIPLRPLSVGDILEGALATVRGHWRIMLGVTLAIGLVTNAVDVVLKGLLQGAPSNLQAMVRNPATTPHDLADAYAHELGSSAVSVPVTLLGMLFATALLTVVVSSAVLGRPTTAAGVWRDARPQLLRLTGLMLLLLLVEVGILGVGIAPGVLVAEAGSIGGGLALISLGGLAATGVLIWLSVRWSLAFPALMLERQGVLAAMRRSTKLVHGAWGRVFGIRLIAGFLALIVALMVQMPLGYLAPYAEGHNLSDIMSGHATLGWTGLVIIGVGGALGAMITYPFTSAVTALLYMDQRIRREALDVELGRAAGLPGYGDAVSVPGPVAP